MDHSRSLRAVHHDQLKKPSCAIGAEKQIPNGVFGDLLDDQCVAHNVFNVFRFDGVPERRAEDLHGQYCTTKPAALASARGSTPGDRMDAGENTPTQRRFGVLGANICWRPDLKTGDQWKPRKPQPPPPTAHPSGRAPSTRYRLGAEGDSRACLVPHRAGGTVLPAT
jgi:hypothetical protein